MVVRMTAQAGKTMFMIVLLLERLAFGDHSAAGRRSRAPRIQDHEAERHRYAATRLDAAGRSSPARQVRLPQRRLVDLSGGQQRQPFDDLDALGDLVPG